MTLTLSVAPTLTLTLTVTLTIQAARGRRRNSYAERLKRVATAERLVTRLESPQKKLPPISGSKGAGAGSSLKDDLRKRFGDDGGAGAGGV